MGISHPVTLGMLLRNMKRQINLGVMPRSHCPLCRRWRADIHQVYKRDGGFTEKDGNEGPGHFAMATANQNGSPHLERCEGSRE